MAMSFNKISPLIVQNRLLSQARSGARARNTAIGSVLNKSSNSKTGSAASDAAKTKNKVLPTLESKTNYTSMKKAGESIKKRAEVLQKIYDRQWEEITEEERAKYKEQAEEEITKFIDDYNTLMNTLTKESSATNNAYFKQLKNYFQSAKSTLAEMGITQNSDGTLSLDKEILKTADIAVGQKVFGGEDSFAGKVKEGAEKIAANAETNLSILNSSLYTGNYSYNRSGNDIFDILTGNSDYNVKG